MRVTHQDIANELGVSRTTVTQALHGTRGSNLRPEMRREVQRAARRLGYLPQNRTTHIIGYVMQMESIKLAGESRMLMLADQALRRAGYRLTLISVHDDEVDSLGDYLSPKTVDGVLFTRWFGGKVSRLLSPEIPWVLLSNEHGVDANANVMTVDTFQASQILAQHLIEAGHERLCLVTGVCSIYFHQLQKAGVELALEEANLPRTNLQTVEVWYDHQIAAGLHPILKSAAPPTALIGASPEKAITLLNLLAHEGFRVPEDISVVSLSDSDLLEPIIPPVTTTTFLDGAMNQAVQRLLELIATPAQAPRQELVPAQIIQRKSVATPCPTPSANH